ncbi:MAG: aldehyde ferredoxin oxidoreductase family protein [Deltaproteobacteria bacterium]|nr:aldehyde ferredoxin oxidoreductase family protein [Deltaproteobacteria bacterium]
MNGYHGKLLEVHLGTQSIEEKPLAEEFLKKYIGGATLGAALIYSRIKKGMDPLDPESPMVFATGPFTGSPIPMVSRYAVCGISPQTGYWGEATSGGTFPFRLKGSGYDAIIITGKSKEPVYLKIDNEKAKILSATHLWGMDSYETQNTIKKDSDDPKMGVACIGTAGEKILRYSCIMNDEGRAAGRSGMGALMGSKNLKAVAVQGKIKPELSNKKKVRELVKEAAANIKKNVSALVLRENGTLFYMDMGLTLGDTPVKYFTKSCFDASKVNAKALKSNYTVKTFACQGCLIGCGHKIEDFKPDIKTVDGPEYETVGAFGPLCLNSDMDSIILAHHLCNTHGIDTISAGVSIAYAMYLFDIGVLNYENCGMDIKWGDSATIIKLLKMIIDQKGIGELLSSGTLAMARKFGRDEGEAAQVKGLEMPMHEGRAFHGEAISIATGPRGACHLKGDYYNVDFGEIVPEYDLKPGDRFVSKGKGAAAAKYQSLRELFDSLTLCKFAPYSVALISQILKNITGWDFSAEDLLAAGDRSMCIKRAVSNKMGLTQEKDCLPDICSKALDEGATAGIEPDMDIMLQEYYTYRGWNFDTGWPFREKLEELGLDEVAADLYNG